MNSFSELDLPQEIQEALRDMNYETPTPVQAQSIPVALKGRDIIASAQTGTGKTAAFGIPLLVQLLTYPQARALILAPTRELAAQIAEVLEALASKTRGIEITLIIGGVGMQPQQRALSRNPQIVVATPGRLVDHLRTKRNLLSNVTFLVLDEADRMLDLGFAPQLRTIRNAISGERQTMLFSATFPTDIAQLSKEWLVEPERITIGAVSKPVDRIAQSALNVSGDEKNNAALAEVNAREGSVIIFARTKRRTDRLAQFLARAGVASCRLHGDRSQNQRQEALDGFRNGRFRVLVATDIAARGIDVPHIEHVINYDLPMVAEDYLHRIGRTGRAGRSGEAICFISPEERPLWRAIERLIASTQGVSSQESRASQQESRAAHRAIRESDRGGRPQSQGFRGNSGGNNQGRSGGGRGDARGTSSRNDGGRNDARSSAPRDGGRGNSAPRRDDRPQGDRPLQRERQSSDRQPQQMAGQPSGNGDQQPRNLDQNDGSRGPRRRRRPRRDSPGNSPAFA